MRAHDPENLYRIGPVEISRALERSLCPAQSRLNEKNASTKQLEFYCLILLELLTWADHFAHFRAPCQYKSTAASTRPGITRAVQRLQGRFGVTVGLRRHLIRLFLNIPWGLSLAQSYVQLSCANFSDSCQKSSLRQHRQCL